MNRLRAAELGLGAVLSLTVIALGARFALYAGGLWRDEVSTLNLALRPTWRDVLESLHYDSAPALYPSLVRLWLGAGFADQDAAMRLLGVLLTGAALVIVWLTGCAIGVRVPLLALSLFAAHGLVVQTVGSVKPYGLGALLALAAFGALAKLATAPGRATFAVAAALCVASVQAGYQNAALVVPAAAVFAAFALRRDPRASAMVAAAAGLAIVSVLPYAPMLRRSQEWRALVQGQITPRAVAGALERAFTDQSLWVAAVWFVAVGVAMFAVVRSVRVSDGAAAAAPSALPAVAAAGAATLSLAPFLMLAGRPPQPWHCMHVLGVAALALDLALVSTIPVRWTRVALALVAGLALLPGAVDRVSMRQTNLDRVARQLEPVVERRDLVVVNPWWLGLTFARYYHGAAPWQTLPPIDDLTVHRYDLLRARMTSPAPLAPLHGAIVETLRSGGRVWIVGAFKPFFVGPGEQPQILPPAPGAPTGWSDLAYANAWATQTGYLVQTTARTWRVVPVNDETTVQPLERVAVIVVEGFRGP